MKVLIISFIKIIYLNFKKMDALEYSILENLSSLIIFHSKNKIFHHHCFLCNFDTFVVIEDWPQSLIQ